MGLLDGKAVVVTGAGRGIGRGHALQFAKVGGASVVINDIDAEEAEKVVAEIKNSGGNAIANNSDICTQSGAAELVEACVSAFGKIDVMMANAGIARDRTFLKMTEDEFDAVMTVHVKGTFHCHQQAALKMKELSTGGVLLSTVSAAHFGNFGQTNYAAAKGAIASMVYTTALELARYGIRVNAISPTGTTRLSDTYVGPDGKKHPMPFIDPELNGPMLIYLCSDEANYITGQIFGTGGERILLLEHPQYGHGMYMPNGWTVEQIQKHFKGTLGNRLQPFGITKPPYRFYEGVIPPSENQ
jgi:3-oxoacyl-[acyl-carrier protein] reductase